MKNKNLKLMNDQIVRSNILIFVYKLITSKLG